MEDGNRNIGKEINIEKFESAEMKVKTRSIKNVYILELAKVNKSKESEAQVDDTYKPNVK